MARYKGVLALMAVFSNGCSGTKADPSATPGGSGGSASAPDGSGGSPAGQAGQGANPDDVPHTGTPPLPFPECTGTPDDFEAFAAKVAADLASHDVVGGGLAIVCGGTTIFATGLGSSEKGGKPVTATTRFQLASATKSLTAALALRLAEKGIVALEEPVSKWVPHVNTHAPYEHGFTLAELLSHTSGYPARLDTADYSDLAASFKANANVPLWSPPGEVFNYSNDAISLAGLVLQTAAGQPFASLVEDEVMKPAGMQHARMHAQAVQSEGDYAVGYSSDGKVYQPTDGYFPMPYYGPMGGAWASAQDLARFAQTLIYEGSLLISKESLSNMTQPRTRTTSASGHHGLGIFVDDSSGSPIWGHSGSASGFRSSYLVLPSRAFAVIMLVNSDAYLPDPYIQLEDAAKIFTGAPIAWSSDGDMFHPDDELDHIGHYQSNTLGQIKVYKSDDDWMQIKLDGDTQTLVPAWRDTYFFTYKSTETTASFFRIGGSVKYVVTAYGVGARTN
jgi:CubicO group peptidase (beta-lactamase class C family)